MKQEIIISLLRQVVSQLVQRSYQAVYNADHAKLLSLVEIEQAVESYPGAMTMPPEENFYDYYEYGQEVDTDRLIEFDLWFDNSKSDLTLSMTIDDNMRYSIENIHVL
jgi:hypothetical protein